MKTINFKKLVWFAGQIGSIALAAAAMLPFALKNYTPTIAIYLTSAISVAWSFHLAKTCKARQMAAGKFLIPKTQTRKA